MNIVLTGSHGYLGTNLKDFLANKGYQVLILDRFISDKTKDSIRFSNFEDDIMDYDAPCVMIHCAGLYEKKDISVLELAQANLFYGINVLEKAIAAKIPYFININTALPKELNFYALSKRQFSEWGKRESLLGKITFIDLYLEHFYGVGVGNNNFVRYLLDAMMRNVPELKLTKGEQQRDFIYITDVLNAIGVVVENLRNFNGYSKVPVGSGETISIKQLVKLLQDLSHITIFCNFGAVNYRNNEVMNSYADISLLTKLGWQPTVDMETGLSLMLEEYK